MTFEIVQCEGCGRSGRIIGKKIVNTPNILQTFLYNLNNSDSSDSNFWLTFDYQKNKFYYSSTLNFVNKNFNDIEMNNEHSNINCFIYPSLQMQNKTIEKISNYKELFPIDISKIQSETISYHLVPWDLPTIYLERYDSYLETLNKYDYHELDSNTKLMINIPLSQNILELNLPSLKPSFISAISLGDISSLLTHPSLLVKYLSHIKSWISPEIILYAPAVPSSYIPILVYLGVDLFDFQFLFSKYTKLNYQNDLILEQNSSINSFINTVHLTQKALRIGKLRDLTRIYANSFPPLKAILRIIDRRIPLEKGTPLYRFGSLYCTDETDFFRPEVSRFRNRVKNRYFPSSEINGFIFLPCSAKKPYSKSKSHQLFRGTIRRSLKRKRHSIDEIILTSPLGLVPRDLEYSFPAAHYDIPVTGEWSEIEKDHLKEDIDTFLEKIRPNIPLVGYLKGAERETLEKVCKDKKRHIYLLDKDIESLTSKEALNDFSLLLREAFSDISLNSTRISKITFLRTVADFQFGKGIGSILISNDVKIQGRKELGIRVTLSKEHFLTFRPETGFLTLSLLAGKRLLKISKNKVTFEGSTIVGSTIFANAIIKADKEIRPNDEVLVIDKDENLLAVGVSYLPGELLVKMKRGKGINIRKKVK